MLRLFRDASTLREATSSSSKAPRSALGERRRAFGAGRREVSAGRGGDWLRPETWLGGIGRPPFLVGFNMS